MQTTTDGVCVRPETRGEVGLVSLPAACCHAMIEPWGESNRRESTGTTVSLINRILLSAGRTVWAGQKTAAEAVDTVAAVEK